MAKNIFNSLWNSLKSKRNKFNYAFLSNYGVGYTSYDENNETYINKGYNYNSIIYSIISKQASKSSSVPLVIKKIKDDDSKKKLDNLYKSTNYDLTPIQRIKSKSLELKAFEDDILSLPLERPNPNQSWREFTELYKIFLKSTGNFYIYETKPDNGINKGVPNAVYILPSQFVQIIIKDNADLLDVTENPIKSYMLIQGKQYLEFEMENVYHVKYSNPNYDEFGEHLYGFSPLRPVLRNINSSNKAVDNNIKTLANGGAFGFIHGKQVALQEGQAKEIKERLSEMNNSPEDLSKIAGISAEIGFTRISLTTDELKPFDYLEYDQKQICNALGYSDKLLNSDAGAKYDNVNQFRKQIVVDDIKPDLNLLCDSFWKPFLAKFKGYDNTEIEYDITELPELQQDMKTMADWVSMLQDRGNLNGDEVREVFNYPSTGLPEHQVYTVSNDVLTLEEAVNSEFRIEE